MQQERDIEDYICQHQDEFHEESDSYSWKEEYIKQVELDRRITKSFEETRDGQPDKA